MDDLMIIELYFARDEQAIEETDTKYGKLCFHMANNFLSNDADAEECVNDTYLTAWNTIPPTRPNNFRAFLCKIVRNLSMKKLEFNLALKRTQNVTVSFSELEEVLPDTRTAPEWEYENLGKIITDFLQAEKRMFGMYSSGNTIFLILSATLQDDIHFPKAKSRICCITPAIG